MEQKELTADKLGIDDKGHETTKKFIEDIIRELDSGSASTARKYLEEFRIVLMAREKSGGYRIRDPRSGLYVGLRDTLARVDLASSQIWLAAGLKGSLNSRRYRSSDWEGYEIVHPNASTAPIGKWMFDNTNRPKRQSWGGGISYWQKRWDEMTKKYREAAFSDTFAEMAPQLAADGIIPVSMAVKALGIDPPWGEGNE